MPKIIKFSALAKKYSRHRNTITNWRKYYIAEGNKINFKDVESVKNFMEWCDKRNQEVGRA